MNHHPSSVYHCARFIVLFACALGSSAALIAFSGCGTSTTRKATEQLLMSDAVDNAIAQIDFRSLKGQKVFIDTTYLGNVPGVGFVNASYIISSLRQQLVAAHCLVQDQLEAADVVIEPRVGALGTDIHEVVYGVPQAGAFSNAAPALTNSPIPPIPEVSIGKSNAQTGIAKVIVFAYDRETRDAVWQSGVAKAESTSQNNWYLGAGPFQKGTIHEGTRFAGQSFPFNHRQNRFENQNAIGLKEDKEFVPFDQPFVFDRSKNNGSSQSPAEGLTDNIQTASHAEPLKQ